MTTYTEVFGGQAIPSSDNSYGEVTLTANQQFYWPDLSSGVYLLYDTMDIHATGAFEITFPSAMEVSVGRSIMFNNLSAFTIIIKDNLGIQIGTLLTGEVRAIYLVDNTTVQGSWEIIGLGSSTTIADASALAGSGLKVISSQLAQNYDAVSLSAATYSLMITDRAKTLISYGGALTLNLLDSLTATNGYMFSLSNQGTGSITIDPSGTELIDEVITKDIAPGESTFIVCNGTKWVTVGYGRSTQFQFTKLVLDISTGSPFTLTSVQAQNKLIQFIGTATSNVIVNVPAVVAVYYLQCSYAGSFTLTVKTLTGTSVILTATDRAIIYCDGLDVVLAQTSAAPAITLSGGASGSVVYQSAPNVTAFTTTGTSGQLLTSGGTGAPTWVDKTASNITNVAEGGIAATDVQAALNELDTEKAPKASPAFTGNGSIAGTFLAGSSLGYSTGAFGTTTQSTNKNTAVTLNKPCGVITMNGSLLGGGSKAIFLVNNSFVSATDSVIVTLNWAGSTNYKAWVYSVGSGAFSICLENTSAGNLSDAVVLNFAVIKGA